MPIRIFSDGHFFFHVPTFLKQNVRNILLLFFQNIFVILLDDICINEINHKLKIRIMKRIFTTMIALALVSISTVACSSDNNETVEVQVDTANPVGAFTAIKTGTLTAQNGTPTKGLIETGVDNSNTTFVHLGSDFTTELGTGTATIYLSRTATFTASPGTGNPDLKLIGIVNKNGEAFYKVDGTIPAGLDYVIVWCGSANIPFGNGLLK